MNVQNLNQQHPEINEIECGNCWGHQEWNGVVCQKQLKRIDKNQDGFILKFVKKYL